MLRITSVVILAVLLLLEACTSVDVDSSEDFWLTSGATYAWASVTDIVANSDLPLAAFQSALDQELLAMGLQKSNSGNPDWLLKPEFTIVRKVQNNDPIFALWVAEKYEEGTLRLKILDPKTNKAVWQGSKWVRLRTVSRTMGGIRQKWAETGETRDWQVKKVSAGIASSLRER